MDQPDGEPQLLTLRDVADLLRVSPATVWRWADEGVIPVIRIGERTVRFRREDIDELLTPVRKESAS